METEKNKPTVMLYMYSDRSRCGHEDVTRHAVVGVSILKGYNNIILRAVDVIVKLLDVDRPQRQKTTPGLSTAPPPAPLYMHPKLL